MERGLSGSGICPDSFIFWISSASIAASRKASSFSSRERGSYGVDFVGSGVENSVITDYPVWVKAFLNLIICPKNSLGLFACLSILRPDCANYLLRHGFFGGVRLAFAEDEPRNVAVNGDGVVRT